MSFIDKLFFKLNPKAIIERSAYFDAEWYKNKYQINDDPAKHYLEQGWTLDYDPSERFSTKDYLINNPDIQGINPLLHYEAFGKNEGRRPFVPAAFASGNYQAERIEIPYDEYYQKIADKKIVSFDVFDTLVIRPYIKAEQLFDYIEDSYQCAGFSDARKNAESTARKQLNKEVNIDEIYSFIPDNYKSLKDIEIELEINECHTNPLIRPLYEKAKELGKRIIVVSDMYLPETVIKEILKANNYEMDQIYVSCDHDKTKGSGKLFKYVTEQEKAKETDFIHFGDNYISDYSEAINSGFEAYQTPKIVDYILSDKRYAYLNTFLNTSNTLSASIYLSLVSEYLSAGQHQFFEYLGYLLGGPLALGYLNFICKEANKNSIDQLLFVSRDGYILKELYEEYFKDNYNIDSQYAYLSRAAIISGAIDNKIETDISKILKVAKVHHPDMIISGDDTKDYETNKKMIDDWSLAQSNNLKKHLESITAGKNNIATVDMFSGNYTSQSGAMFYLKDKVKAGFYAGNFAEKDFNHLTYSDRLLGMRDNLPVKMSEFIITSFESPICGVNEDGTPVYEYEQKRERKQRYDDILKGIERFFDDYLRFFKIDNSYILSLEEWLILADTYLKKCDEEDIRALSEIIDSENPVSDKNDKSIADLIRQYRDIGY